MGVNWAAGLIRWHPHVRPNGEYLSLSHLHPFRFDVWLEAERGRPRRLVNIHVGFSCHVFTCDIGNAGAAPELYSDDRETRAFDERRYNWSFRPKGIVTELEARKCYFAGGEHFVTFEVEGVRDTLEYRVFFAIRRKDSSTLELVVQSAYVGEKDLSPRGVRKKPIRFCVIASRVLAKQRVVEAP
jgi:hypothetical protein